MTAADLADLRVALDVLAERVEALPFALPEPARTDRRAAADDLVRALRAYLVPRLADLDAPIVAVLLGSTGSGKSTVLNSLAQARVSEPGAVRPTTREPVVWCAPAHVERYGDGFLKTLGGGRPARVVTGDDPLLAGVSVVDAPDIDSIVTEHRTIAEDLLAVADLCVFVTSAQRYADAVPWTFLRRLRARDLPTVFVLNRVPDRGGDEITADFLVRLRRDGGVEEPDLLRVAEQQVDPSHGAVEPAAVAPLRERLETLADREVRMREVARGLAGGVAQAVDEADAVADAAASERGEAQALRTAAEAAYRRQLDALEASLDRGELIRREVLARWQEYVGTGQVLRALSEGLGRVRAWVRRVVGGEPERIVAAEARSELVAAVVRRAQQAATEAVASWELEPAGARLLRAELYRTSDDLEARTSTAVQDWMAELAALVERQGAGRRRVAQAASTGVNAAAVVALLAVFAQTGGLTGAEVGVTAGAAAAQQRVLEHVFGAAAARTIVRDARARLLDGFRRVLAEERRRFLDTVDAVTPSAAAVEAVRDAAARVGATAGALDEIAADG